MWLNLAWKAISQQGIKSCFSSMEFRQLCTTPVINDELLETHLKADNTDEMTDMTEITEDYAVPHD